MSVSLPESVDAWRMVAARRSFEGVIPVAALARLRDLLADASGTVSYQLQFGRDELDTGFVEVRVSAPLTLLCQRSLEPFVQPVQVETRLGLIRAESEEPSLPPETEPLLVAEDGRLVLLDVIEDELLLALPLVPINPEAQLPVDLTEADPQHGSAADDNPFAVLRELKQ